MEKSERLKQTRIFADFGEDEITQVARLALEKIYPSGGKIVREGELGEGLFTIVEGEVEVSKTLPGTKELEPLATLKPGDHFGEMGLIDGMVASATITATKPTICFVLKRKDYYDMLAKEPIVAMKLYRFYAKTLCDRLRKTDNFILGELKDRKKKTIKVGLLKGSN